GKVADRQTTTLEWASTSAQVPAPQLMESTALASISPASVQPRDGENYRTDARLSELRTSPQSALTGEGPLPPISPTPIQLQPDREEVAPPKIRPVIPLEARWKEPDAASSTLLKPIQLRSDRTEMMPVEVSKSPSQNQPNSEELAVLLKRGKELIATG